MNTPTRSLFHDFERTRPVSTGLEALEGRSLFAGGPGAALVAFDAATRVVAFDAPAIVALHRESVVIVPGAMPGFARMPWRTPNRPDQTNDSSASAAAPSASTDAARSTPTQPTPARSTPALVTPERAEAEEASANDPLNASPRAEVLAVVDQATPIPVSASAEPAQVVPIRFAAPVALPQATAIFFSADAPQKPATFASGLERAFDRMGESSVLRWIDQASAHRQSARVSIDASQRENSASPASADPGADGSLPLAAISTPDTLLRSAWDRVALVATTVLALVINWSLRRRTRHAGRATMVARMNEITR